MAPGAQFNAICRFGTMEVDFVKEGYLDNGRFECIKKSEEVVLKDNLPFFPSENMQHEKIDTFYRTCFGPTFTHNGRIYSRSNKSLTYAATRLLGARPEVNGRTHWELCDLQRRFIDRHKKIFTDYGHILCQNLEEKYDDLISSVIRLVKEPHPKKRERIRALKELLETNQISSEIWFREVLGNVKGEEWAKPLKYPRLVNDLTTCASLLGATATHIMKDAMAAAPLWYKGGVAIFVAKPNHEILERVFELLITASHPVFIYFSDDSCLGITINGKRLMANIDISTCDGSHTRSLFNTLTMVTRGKIRLLMRRLIAQCAAPLKLKTRHGKHKIKYKTCEPVLYSGSTLTTLVNNLANICIFMSVMDTDVRGGEDVVSAAAAAGYNVSFDVCSVPEKLQFLKHSPCWYDGKWRAVINAGVILRLSGMCKRDLPGSKKISIEQRAKNFQSSLIECFKNTPQHELIESLKPESAQQISGFKSGHYIVDNLISSVFPVPVEHFTKRYDITPLHYQEMCHYARHGFGHFIRCHASERILKLDYGLDAAHPAI